MSSVFQARSLCSHVPGILLQPKQGLSRQIENVSTGAFFLPGDVSPGVVREARQREASEELSWPIETRDETRP